MENEVPPHYAIATIAFAAMGLIFFSHGLATPGALIAEFHPAVSWGAWLTLLVGGGIFAAASIGSILKKIHWLSVRVIVISTTVLTALYFGMALFAPEILSQIEENANPTLRLVIFYISLFLWIVSAVMLYSLWLKTRKRLDGVLALVAVWLAIATISMHMFPNFYYSWWIYHINLLGAFIILVLTLLIEFEQLREFRLMPYFLALSLILTALFSLVGSYLSDKFTQNLLTGNSISATSEILLQARRRGLLIVGGSMGMLMFGLLSVTWRADKILTNQKLELKRISTQLQTYSEWLLGPDLLGRLLKNPKALSLVRQERTILFLDIRNFTSWSEIHSPEEVVKLLNVYYMTVEATLKETEVIKYKFAADETMAVFADASTAIHEAIRLRDQTIRQLENHGLGVGIGIHNGPVVEGILGSMGVKFFDVIGDTVNTTKRIESAAGKNEILISEETLLSTTHSVRVDMKRYITAKGKDSPITVCSIQCL